MINGRLDDDFVTWLREYIDDHADAFHNARNVSQPFTLHFPAVAGALPVDDSLPVGFGRHGVAQHGVFQAFAECFHNERRRGKVHVGHPQGQQVATAEVVGEHLVFHGARGTAVDDLVKIVISHSIRFMLEL